MITIDSINILKQISVMQVDLIGERVEKTKF